MSARLRSRAWRASTLGFALVMAVTSGSCTKTGPARGGLMLVVSREGSLPIGRLDVSVTSNDETLLNQSYRVPEEAQLPTTIAVVSNGNSTARATISITGWEVVPGQPDIPLDRRDAIVTQIPVDRVVEFKVVLTARCTKWVDGSGQPACQPSGYTCDSNTGDCVSPEVTATDLAPYEDGNEQGGAGDSTASGGSNAVAGGAPGRVGSTSDEGGASGEGALGGDAALSGDGGASGASGTKGEAGEGGEAGVGRPSTSTCGNGSLEDATERCDDGNTDSGDGCSSNCRVETGWSCTQSEPTVCEPACGDGLSVGDEARAGGCDDENKKANDGCSPGCVVEPGYVCSGAPSACEKSCGNGKLDANETCDDGNAATGDGCTACAIESGFTCDNTKQPSKCTDINECKSAPPPCDVNAVCTNTSGSFSCKCAQGYSGTGQTCADIDECATTRPCSLDATCTNSVGAFSCACNPGFAGDGFTCVQASCAKMVGNECRGDYCCSRSAVSGGSFHLGGSTSAVDASISPFTLDTYEVTVGRFRNFVSAYTGPPADGAGAHPLLSSSGWQTAWNGNVADKATLIAHVQCDSTYQTWNATGANDQLPMNCVSWYEAFAFCAWDGGRLPTEAEWESAAAAGAYEILYPWGNAPIPNNNRDSSADFANYYGLGDGSIPGVFAFTDILPVGSRPAGVGYYNQQDQAGSMWEWTLDYYANPYPINPCEDCANLSLGTERVARGGSWRDQASFLTTTYRRDVGATYRDAAYGFRCARSN